LWGATIVAAINVPNLEEDASGISRMLAPKEFQDAMHGYHDLIAQGKRETYQLELQLSSPSPMPAAAHAIAL